MTTPRIPLSRRRLLAGAAACAGTAAIGSLRAEQPQAATAETLAGRLHASLTPAQREKVCFPWDYRHPKFGLLRTRVGANWNATEPTVAGDFFTQDQRRLVREIFEQLIEPDWHARFDKQMEDDCGGFGHDQSIALLGEPGSGKFQFLITGRHMTLRCDGDSAEHVAFGGPIFYGHDAGGSNEGADHKGNVFWPQAVAANKVYAMLDGKQRAAALVTPLPKENAITFRAAGTAPAGIAVTELAADQRAELNKVLAVLLEPYRTRDRDEVRGCLAKQGGLDRCRLAFYKDGDIGNDGVWDNWRLEGPAFVWHFRGAPHVHVWVNIADTPDVPTNA
ncbi:MAG: DUF3500 domain-containing protein [Planctomycetaceae bacterium]|nr:DUF3500 domain-containing protein [Planctomycetaceae bacterium]